MLSRAPGCHRGVRDPFMREGSANMCSCRKSAIVTNSRCSEGGTGIHFQRVRPSFGTLSRSEPSSPDSGKLALALQPSSVASCLRQIQRHRMMFFSGICPLATFRTALRDNQAGVHLRGRPCLHLTFRKKHLGVNIYGPQKPTLVIFGKLLECSSYPSVRAITFASTYQYACFIRMGTNPSPVVRTLCKRVCRKVVLLSTTMEARLARF